MGLSRERAIDVAEMVAPFFGEFMGTFLVAVTHGCNALTGSVVWMPTSVAFAIMVAMLSMASISGGHMNPAVSLAFGLVRKMGWLRVFGYCVAQLCGGLAGGVMVIKLVAGSIAIEPKHGFDLLDAMVVEVLFTNMMCFVALSCMASERSNPRSDPNHYSAMAVGFVAIAGGHAAYEISGSFFNPALTLGFGLSGDKDYFMTLMFCSFQVGSAILAATLFFLTHPEELPGVEAIAEAAADGAAGLDNSTGLGCQRACGAVCPCAGARSGKQQQQSCGAATSLDAAGAAAVEEQAEVVAAYLSTYRAAVPVRLLSEFLGSFAVASTFALASACNTLLLNDENSSSLLAHPEHHSNSTAASKLGGEVLPVSSVPWATGAAVLSMGYALGNVSGGHFNPATTIAALFSRRSSVVTFAEFLPTVAAQVGGGVVAAVVFTCVNRGRGELTRISVLPVDARVAFTEALFTLVVAFVALCSTTVTSPKYFRAPNVKNFSFALAMGMAVAAGGFATDGFSSGHLNPAITVGVAAGNMLWGQRLIGEFLWNALKYLLWQSVGGVGAGLLFIIAHPMEYKRDPLLVKN